MGYNIPKELDEKIKEVDELEKIEEEDEEDEEVDWWELTLIILKHTHPFGVVFYSNRFCPKHIRLSFVFFELMLLMFVCLLCLE